MQGLSFQIFPLHEADHLRCGIFRPHCRAMKLMKPGLIHLDTRRFLESNASKISAFDHLWRLNLAPGKIQDSGLQLLHVLHKPDSTGFQGYHHQNSLLRANKSLTQTANPETAKVQHLFLFLFNKREKRIKIG